MRLYLERACLGNHLLDLKPAAERWEAFAQKCPIDAGGRLVI